MLKPVNRSFQLSEAARTSWQQMLKAILVAALVAAVLDTLIQVWRTPVGWSTKMILGLLAIDALVGFLGALAVGLLIGLPVSRLLVRKERFERATLAFAGALLGALVAIILSAFGNTYVFMSGIGFWQSFVVDAAMGATAGFLWWLLETRNAQRAQTGMSA